MRPFRLLLSVCFVLLTLLLTFYSLLYSHSPNNAATSSHSTRKSGLRSLFSFHIPSVLFPPTAMISLYEDNSTFFLSRPADFGPTLPPEGQSGPLWIGSGFGEESTAKFGWDAQAEGELGCSDIPGWPDGPKEYLQEGNDGLEKRGKVKGARGLLTRQEKAARSDDTSQGSKSAPSEPREEDGTDDYLHYPLTGVPLLRGRRSERTPQASKIDDVLEHADIQALQESAEIAGKVVLLSRGGCGFLEKAKWVQRRGGVALIVGDNKRGGTLLTMYAHGDTSNITIPCLFTSRFSAHLLSSLMPSKNGPTEELLKTGGSIKKLPKNGKGEIKTEDDSRSRPPFSPKSISSENYKPVSVISDLSSQSEGHKPSTKKFSWIHSITSVFRSGGRSNGIDKDSSRPPSSGQMDWVKSESWDDEPEVSNIIESKNSPLKSGERIGTKVGSQKAGEKGSNDFVIGVQDWRDPDMIGPVTTQTTGTAKFKTKTPSPSSSTSPTFTNINAQKTNTALSGGSITPGSGVYQELEGLGSSKHKTAKTQGGTDSSSDTDGSKGWLGNLMGKDPSNHMSKEVPSPKKIQNEIAVSQGLKKADFKGLASNSDEHEGLWVTMSPTSISTTPFFDTLLVLVVSPLVTLTVVYALLLLRSRIRRRRWRAPKSVVDQLPVRTYRTISCSSSSTSSQTPSPTTSSPTSPLLRTSSRPNLTRSRPRSRTTSTISEHTSIPIDNATNRATFSRREKARSPRRYKGRQIECVVCLEEYVDGQSQVMSLPCGHEFHAECITPWLTTRRRTCPICKGDVVRSINNGERASNPQRRHYRDDPDSVELQAEVAETRNESPSAAIPIPQRTDGDLERGNDMVENSVNDSQAAYTPRGGWRAFAARSLSAIGASAERNWRQASEDRNR